MFSGALVSIYQVVGGGLLTLYCMIRFMLEYHHGHDVGHDVGPDVGPAAGGHH